MDYANEQRWPQLFIKCDNFPNAYFNEKIRVTEIEREKMMGFVTIDIKVEVFAPEAPFYYLSICCTYILNQHLKISSKKTWIFCFYLLFGHAVGFTE